jgi:hypothetical protein
VRRLACGRQQPRSREPPDHSQESWSFWHEEVLNPALGEYRMLVTGTDVQVATNPEKVMSVLRTRVTQIRAFDE